MKRILSVALAVLMLFSAVSVAGAENENEVLRDSLVMVDNGEWWGADVTQLDGTAASQGLIGDPLCTLDHDGKLQPNVCSEVKVSDDLLTITCTIPEGMYYFSGEQVEPEDVVASILRIQEVCPLAASFNSISDVYAEGRDVIIVLDHYASDLYGALSSSFMTIMDKDVLDSTSDDDLYWDCHPYGMYDLKEHVSGAYVVLQRNPGYKTHNPFVENKGAALVEEITVRFISEEFTAAQEFNAGNVQYITSMSPDGMAQITAENAVKENLLHNPNVYYIEMKLDDPIIGNETLRQAIALSINREELCTLYHDAIMPAYSFATSSIIGYNEKFAAEYKENMCNNLEAAKAMLDEAGIVDTDGDGIREMDGTPLVIHFVYGNVPQDILVCQGLQIQLQELGVYLDLDEQDDNYHYDSLANGEFQMGMSRFNTADIVQLYQWVLCYFPSFDYLSDYGCDGEDQFYELCDQLAQETDPEAYEALTYQLETICCSSTLVIPVYTNLLNIIYADDVTPGVYMGDGQIFFNDLH